MILFIHETPVHPSRLIRVVAMLVEMLSVENTVKVFLVAEFFNVPKVTVWSWWDGISRLMDPSHDRTSITTIRDRGYRRNIKAWAEKKGGHEKWSDDREGIKTNKTCLRDDVTEWTVTLDRDGLASSEFGTCRGADWLTLSWTPRELAVRVSGGCWSGALRSLYLHLMHDLIITTMLWGVGCWCAHMPITESCRINWLLWPVGYWLQPTTCYYLNCGDLMSG